MRWLGSIALPMISHLSLPRWVSNHSINVYEFIVFDRPSNGFNHSSIRILKTRSPCCVLCEYYRGFRFGTGMELTYHILLY